MQQTAPIERPHKINFLRLNFYFNLSMTDSTSYFSFAPNDRVVPSEFPHPEKSKLQNENPALRIDSA